MINGTPNTSPLSVPIANDKTNKNKSDEINGEKLFNAVGCAVCHIVAPNESDLPDINTSYTLLSQQGPNLINLGSKTTSEWIYKWIKNTYIQFVLNLHL